MKQYIFTAAIAAATAFSTPASAQSLSLDAILAQIALQCESTATLASCDALVEQQINALMASGALSDSARASAIARVVETATSALNRSSGTSGSIATEIQQIVGDATTQLNTIAARSPDATAAVNSAVSRTTIAVLTVAQDQGMTGGGADTDAIVAALNNVATASTDTSQKDAVEDIADTLEAGGSIVDVIEEIETVNSYASPS